MTEAAIIDAILNSMDWEKEYDFKTIYISTSAPVNDYKVDLLNKQMFDEGLIVPISTVYYSIAELQHKNELVKISLFGMRVKELGGWKNYQSEINNTSKKSIKWNWNNLSNVLASVSGIGLCILGILTYIQTDKWRIEQKENQALQKQVQILLKTRDSLLHSSIADTIHSK